MKNKIVLFALTTLFLAQFSVYATKTYSETHSMEQKQFAAEFFLEASGPLVDLGFEPLEDLQYNENCDCWTIIGYLHVLNYADSVLCQATVYDSEQGVRVQYIDAQHNSLPKGLFYWESTESISTKPGGMPYILHHGAYYNQQGQRWHGKGHIHPTPYVAQRFHPGANWWHQNEAF